ncbi:MAG TPA: hypothetical protein PK514_07965 [Spirochaetota bacterium]|nr:hypothetical protein [Spirochaetota bacterium]
MARIKLPSYIKEGSGRMEDAVIVTKNGTSYMMVYKKYSRGNTASQAAVNNAFRTVIVDWKYLRGIIRKAWDSSSENGNVSGYNLFIGENMSRRRSGEPIMLCPGMGEEILMNFTAEPGTCAGEVICSFLAAEPGCHVTFFSRKETAPDENSIITRHDAGADLASTFTITGLEPGAQYHIYAVVTDAAYEEAATISASVAAKTESGK